MSETPALEAIVRQVGGDPADLPFWEACREGRFLLHRCDRCGRSYWPASRCMEHGDAAMRWVEGSGRGVLYTYTVMHHAYTRSMKDKLPYIVGVIQLEEGPFFHGNVVDCPLEALAVGMPLRSEMVAHESGLTVPVFRRA
ncbi:MAG TPA: OB-fold domain-containing protein [Nevskiaceae bacterium]|nr:OB-fold domain-containing protein [Nevskiaceae bacterium]